MLADIRAAINLTNRELLQRAAHSLKGLIKNFDSGEAAATAGRLEAMGRDGALEGATEQLVRLEHEVQQLTQALREFSVAGIRGE